MPGGSCCTAMGRVRASIPERRHAANANRNTGIGMSRGQFERAISSTRAVRLGAVTIPLFQPTTAVRPSW
jgi:hypothetical protein